MRANAIKQLNRSASIDVPLFALRGLAHTLLMVITIFSPSLGKAYAQRDKSDVYRQEGYTVRTAIPVYSQLIGFSYPRGFKSVHEQSSEKRYIHEWIPKGETINNWSQMITLTGSKGLSSDPYTTPEQVIAQIASGFKNACPSTFATKVISRLPVSGHDAFSAIVGCGNVNSGPSRSEIAVLVAIKGSSDYYTIQFAERSSASNIPPTLDTKFWHTKAKRLEPIKVCDIVANESWPYPSCFD